MLVKNFSAISKKINTMNINVTEEQVSRWRNHQGLIQDIMPDLTPDEREFLMTGTTREEWDEVFGGDK